MKDKKYFVLGIILVVVLSLTLVSAVYTRSVPAYTQYPSFIPTGGSFQSFDRSMCEAGQDFLLQVSPFGCTPIVRSDLLEEQNVPVLCPISATKLNPLIDVESIDYMTFSGQFPQEVSGVAYHPGRAALGRWGAQTDTPVLANLGYAVIVLKRQPNESAMPDFVEGNLTATIRYDIQNAFGVGQASYYLPQLTDEEWDNKINQYSFWDGKGYLRADDVGVNDATISLYSDRENSGFGRVDTGKRKIYSVNLKVGETSGEIFMPGFDYCMGSMRLRLNSLEDVDMRARFNINSDIMEVADEEKFLGSKCRVRDIRKEGVVQTVKVMCEEDDRRNTFDLSISPSVNLNIGGDVGEYGVGDWLYPAEEPGVSVYLVSIGTEDNSISEKDLFVRLMRLEKDKDKLERDELPLLFISRVSGIKISYSEEKLVFGKDVALLGFGGPQDKEITNITAREYYEKATEDYKIILDSFAGEKYKEIDTRTLGEQALTRHIDLAWRTEQKRTVVELCDDFRNRFPNSVEPEECNNAYELSNQESSVRDVFINGRAYSLSFTGVSEPTFEEYGARITVKEPNGTIGDLFLTMNQIRYLNESSNEFIQLISVDQDFARVNINVARKGVVARVGEALTTNKKTLRKDTPEVDGDYVFTLREINLKKSAKVSVIPNINYASTTADFNFRIGIEKRGIQLSPEKTRVKINSLNETLTKWRDRSDKLGGIVKGFKTACLGTGAFLTVKNFFANLGGKGIARQKVMRGENGWVEICESKVNSGEYRNVDSCLLDNSDAINFAVDEYSGAMELQNEHIEDLQKSCKIDDGFLGEDIIDTDCLTTGFVDSNFKSELGSNLDGRLDTIKINNRDVNVSDIISAINENTTFLSQARDIQLNSRLLDSDNAKVRQMARDQIEADMKDIWINSRQSVERQDFSTMYNAGEAAALISTQELREIPITSVETFEDARNKNSFTGGNISDDSSVYYLKDRFDGKEYLLVLDNNHIVTNTYVIGTGNVLTRHGTADDEGNVPPNPLGLQLNWYDRTSYENKYQNPEIRYYETEPYKGLPAIVPFDVQNGWYASIKSTLPIGGAIRSYDDSGRVSSFYLCNVGVNKKEEFNSGIGDDICEMINLGTGQPFNQFPGLGAGEASRLVTRAVSAIETASRAYRSGVSYVGISGQRIPVGTPYASIPDIQCQDFMSPSDCNILFNVCDPVVCPSSRCDLDGNYPVQDVVQSGIIGSLALCLPNFPEVKVPICLSGVHAGIEGYLSVLDSYQRCLQTSLDTGQTVGICDELNSLYQCEFFWRQTLPLAKAAAPKIIGAVLGQNVRGGGEYLGVQDAFDSAEQSFDYFTQYYAANSYQAFKARSAQDVGGEICKGFISVVNPQGGNLLDALTEPDVPAQFIGNFDEIPYTTATNPPISHYKVFYHIYAGKDVPAYYEVYLRDPSGSSFYQDTAFRRVVAKGFIGVGDYATETRDFTAPSGYKQLCIIVNGREECGFKQVTTDASVNFLTDLYLAEQASQTDIKSETQCVSGSPSAYSFLNPLQVLESSAGVQAGAEEVLNPAIYNRGIIRICATDSPGQNSDALAGEGGARWKDVGYCDNKNMRCWLDSKSVRDVVRTTFVEDQILGEVEDDYIDRLIGASEFLTDEGFETLVQEISDLGNDNFGIIDKASENLLGVFHNFQRAYLHLQRGNAYRNLAVQGHQTTVRDKTQTPETPDELGETLEQEETTEREQEGTIIGECDSYSECRIVTGNLIFEIAEQKKAEYSEIDFDTVEEDTGAKSFECLILQIARGEGNLLHCERSHENNDPLYCEGDIDKLQSGDSDEDDNPISLGVMQINKNEHGEKLFFEENVEFGIDLLIQGYNENKAGKAYNCLLQADGNFLPVPYAGWNAALRDYNGWNTKCLQTEDDGSLKLDVYGDPIPVGNPNYVNYIRDLKDEVEVLFPEDCGS